MFQLSMLILLQIENASVTNENTSDDIKTDENLADETPQKDVEQAVVPNQDPEQVNYFLFWTFSQTHTVGNNGINANFVFPYTCSFRQYLDFNMLVNVKSDISW